MLKALYFVEPKKIFPSFWVAKIARASLSRALPDGASIAPPNDPRRTLRVRGRSPWGPIWPSSLEFARLGDSHFVSSCCATLIRATKSWAKSVSASSQRHVGKLWGGGEDIVFDAHMAR